MKLHPMHVSVLLALVASPFAAHAGGGAIEINQDCAAVGCFAGASAGFPIVINKPGSYVLTSDLLVNTAGANAIVIDATPVDLNLNGHTVDGSGTCTGVPVTCTAGNGDYGIVLTNDGAIPVYSVHIHNGTVRGFANGSYTGVYVAKGGDGVVLERLNVVENANGMTFSASPGPGGTVRLRDSQVARNGGWGVSSSSPVVFAIDNCDISGNKNFGVGGPGTITGSRINNNGGYGIVGSGASVALGQNSFAGNNGGGANLQYSITTVRDMGGNACIDHTPCP